MGFKHNGSSILFPFLFIPRSSVSRFLCRSGLSFEASCLILLPLHSSISRLRDTSTSLSSWKPGASSCSVCSFLACLETPLMNLSNFPFSKFSFFLHLTRSGTLFYDLCGFNVLKMCLISVRGLCICRSLKPAIPSALQYSLLNVHTLSVAPAVSMCIVTLLTAFTTRYSYSPFILR